MKFEQRKLAGVFEITLNKIGDSRGYFVENYNKNDFSHYGLQTDWMQENQSFSTRIHTLRGLHFQAPPFAQTKLVRVILGKIYDVFVDIRKDSLTFGQWDSVEISEEKCNAIYIPHGFAHGFCTLTQDVIVQYKVDNVYAPEFERGIRWNDPNLNINWNIAEPFLSLRDTKMPFFTDFVSPF
jgi:dTDP-4-dehydrorhamnose 3,5-epimerase